MPARWLTLLALVGALWLGTGLAETAPATLTVAQGVLVVHANGQAEAGQTGMTIGAGDRLETRSGGKATVRFTDTSELELGAETTVDLQQLDQQADGSVALTASQSRGLTVSRTAPGREAELRIGGGVSHGVAVLRQGGMIVRTDGDSGNVTLACDGRASRVFFPYEDRRVRCEEGVILTFTASQEIVTGYLRPNVPAVVAVFDNDLLGREHGTEANREPEDKEAVALSSSNNSSGTGDGRGGSPPGDTGGIGEPPTPTPTPLPLVSNDDFRNARTLPLPGSDTQDTRAATIEAGEPVPTCQFGSVGHSVWYRVIPGRNGTLRVSTAGSDYDTVLAVYAGPSPQFLSQRACNDNAAGGGRTSLVTLSVSAGETLSIQVTGFQTASGLLQIQVSLQ